MSNRYRFTYLRTEPTPEQAEEGHRGFPIACIATDYVESDQKAYVGVSVVHPRDLKSDFSKRLARSIAAGRADNTPLEIPVMVANSKATSHEILLSVMKYLQTYHDLPFRVRKAITVWLTKLKVAELKNEVVKLNALTSSSLPKASLPLPKITAGVRHISASKRNSLISYTADIVPTIPKHDTWPLPPITMGGF